MAPQPRAEPAVLCAVLAALFAGVAAADTIVPAHFDDQLVAGNLELPTNAVFLADGRVLITEQATGRIRVVVPGGPGNLPVLGKVDSVYAGAEAGLIGIAVDPAWPVKPYVYVQATRSAPNQVVIWRYRVTGALSAPTSSALTFVAGSRYTVLAIPDHSPKHNGGTLRFGLDGRLYSGVGDDDDPCSAQDLTAPTGKILRLDVSGLPDGGGGPPLYSAITPADNPFVARPDSTARLVWAYGLRNPFAFEVDKVTGCLIVGEVGNDKWEEIDRVCSGGQNFGWPLFEGPDRLPIPCTSPDTTNLVAPSYAYPHEDTGWAVVGGPAYHAPPGATSAYPASYEGSLFLGDTWRGLIKNLVPNGPGWALAPPAEGQPDPVNWATGASWISHMEVGPDGALWYTILYRDTPAPGELRRILYFAPSVAVDPPGGSFALAAPRPSPSRGPVALAWSLPRAGRVTLTVLDTRGRIVRRLDPGAGRATWDGADERGRPAPPGLYFVRMTALGEVREARLVRL